MKVRIVLTDGVVVEADGTAGEIADLTEALRRSHQVARPGGDGTGAPSDTIQPSDPQPDGTWGLIEPGDEEAPEPTGEGDEPGQWGLEPDEEVVEPDEPEAQPEEVDAPSRVTTAAHG